MIKVQVPKGHETHTVVGMIQPDGSVRPVSCSCGTLWK